MLGSIACAYIGHVSFSVLVYKICPNHSVYQVVGIIIVNLFGSSGSFSVPQGTNTSAYLDWTFQATYSWCMQCV